ncbi:hypothetical protein ACFSW4_07745 [Piscibacillus salipiscarius]|uniref:Uncharacterized protein n=2 Tax=Piscibacillus salipiscarius TaxID=299480 RepID=A0ABW5QA59_9BACI
MYNRVNKLSKNYKKGLEKIKINPCAFCNGEETFYYVLYKNILIGNVKGYALINPNGHTSKDEAKNVFTAHMMFAVTVNNIKNLSERTQVELNSHSTVKNYLNKVLSLDILDPNQREIFQNAYEVLNDMFQLQEEFEERWKEANSLLEEINNKGFFSNNDLEILIKYLPLFNLIQYKQLHTRFKNSKDFDFVYKHREVFDEAEISFDNKILKSMITDVIYDELNNSINKITKNINITSVDTYETIYEKWNTYYREGLNQRVNDSLNLLRYPQIW